ncbi:MAG TPA: hypothetical protein VL982_02645 [Burkholderiales bacterium]|nr:hypothetical protein [Burkholderiales bacterium]
MRTALLLPLAVALINFAWMPGQFLDGDPAAWREEARSLALAGELAVPARVAERFGEPGQYFVRNEDNGLYYSKYGLMNSLMSVPPLLLERLGGGASERLTYPSLLLHNLWNIVLSVLLALVLYRLAGLYTQRPGIRVAFVIAILYGSALWFYQRAQSSELYQVLFFSALFLCLVRFLRTRGWAWLAWTWLFAAALVFTRLAYGLLLPVIALAAFHALASKSWQEPRPARATLIAWAVLPPALALALLAWVNEVKFGAPWLTGYHQWRPETTAPSGRLADGLWGFLFAPRFSIFTHVPLLLFALAGAREFWRRYRTEAVTMLALFLPLLLFISKLPVWSGEFTYGPRYVLFALPVLSLPAVLLAERVVERLPSWRARAWTAAALVVLAYSAYLQVQVNRLGFWMYYEARWALENAYTDTAAEYFRDHHAGIVCADLLHHRDNLRELPYFAEFRRKVTPEIADGYVRELGRMIDRGNWYWKRSR